MSALMPWADFNESFGRLYKPLGRPAKPARLTVRLHYLKHSYDLSDEETVDSTFQPKGLLALRGARRPEATSPKRQISDR